MGFVSSILGIGGGLFLVPTLVFIFGLPIHSAVGTSLVGVFFTSLSSTVIYRKMGYIKKSIVIPVIAGALPGVVAGSLLSTILASQILEKLFGLFLLYPAIRMMFMRDVELEEREAGDTGYFLLGLSAGIISGLFGVGGGIVLVPALVMVFRIPVREAVATSLFFTIFTGFGGSVTHYLIGGIDPLIAGTAGSGVAVGAQIGARSVKLIKSIWIRRVFGALMMYVSLRFLL